MRSVEVTGKTIEEATAAAARQLDASEDELTIEVLEESRKLLGFLGGHEFRIRASVAQGPEAEHDQPPSAGDKQDTDEPEQIANGAEDHHAPTDEGDADAAEIATANDTIARKAASVLDQILSLMGVQAEAVVRSVDTDEVTVEIRGGDAGQLIGRHGATLDALQLVVAIIANRDMPHGARVILDIEGYRERRTQMLQGMAQSHATKAKEARKEIVITDLKPYERRIVHLTLKDDPEVETYSEGEGDARHIVISPKVQ